MILVSLPRSEGFLDEGVQRTASDQPPSCAPGTTTVRAQALHRRLNVLVITEQVRRIVLVLHSHKPLVIRPVGGRDALGSLVGLQADLVDVAAAGGGRITSASSRVQRMFTSSAAGSIQLDRQPHSHSAPR